MLKIIAIILFFILGEFLIWFIFVRQESFIWMNEKLNHNVSPYAISQIDDGRVIVSHVVKRFEYILPIGFEIKEEPMLKINYKEGGKNICQVVSLVVDVKNGINGLKQKDDSYHDISVNGTNVMESLPTEDSPYRLAVFGEDYYVENSLIATEENQTRCQYFIKQIVKSFRKY